MHIKACGRQAFPFSVGSEQESCLTDGPQLPKVPLSKQSHEFKAPFLLQLLPTGRKPLYNFFPKVHVHYLPSCLVWQCAVIASPSLLLGR